MRKQLYHEFCIAALTCMVLLCIAACSQSGTHRTDEEWGNTNAGIASVDSLNEFRQQSPLGWTKQIPDTLDIRADSSHYFFNLSAIPSDDLQTGLWQLLKLWLAEQHALPAHIRLHYSQPPVAENRAHDDDALKAVQDSLKNTLALQSGARSFETLPASGKDSLQERFPVLFQSFK